MKRLTNKNPTICRGGQSIKSGHLRAQLIAFWAKVFGSECHLVNAPTIQQPLCRDVDIYNYPILMD